MKSNNQIKITAEGEMKIEKKKTNTTNKSEFYSAPKNNCEDSKFTQNTFSHNDGWTELSIDRYNGWWM